MKIAMILDNVFPPDPRVENEARTLIQNGHSVCLFSIDYSHRLKKYEEINGIEVHRKHLPKYLYKFSALAYTLPYYHFCLQKIIYEFITENDIQVIHIHDIQIARSVFRANRSLGKPVVLDLHENRPEIMKYYTHVNTGPGRVLIKASRWKKYEYRYIREADKVIVVTDEAKKHYAGMTGADEEKFYVVPNSVRPEFYNDYTVNDNILTRHKDKYVVLYLGDTGLRRGLETAIRSLEFLIPLIPDIRLLIVGRSKADPLLKRLVSKNHWNDYVEFAGWKDEGLFQSFLLASDIGISPIHRNLHHDTTYANKIFQYMAFGNPVVVSNCTAQENLVKKYQCGLVFKDRDVRDFADKIISLYSDRDLYDRLSANAREAIRSSLNWDILSTGLIKLYGEIPVKRS
ncbi:MAG: glycosyltransferase family 4 protein [Bacteroidales bacterium]